MPYLSTSAHVLHRYCRPIHRFDCFHTQKQVLYALSMPFLSVSTVNTIEFTGYNFNILHVFSTNISRLLALYSKVTLSVYQI